MRTLRNLKRAKKQLEDELKHGGMLTDTPALLTELAYTNVEVDSLVNEIKQLETVAGNASTSIDRQVRDPNLRLEGQGSVTPTSLNTGATSSSQNVYSVTEMINYASPISVNPHISTVRDVGNGYRGPPGTTASLNTGSANLLLSPPGLSAPSGPPPPSGGGRPPPGAPIGNPPLGGDAGGGGMPPAGPPGAGPPGPPGPSGGGPPSGPDANTSSYRTEEGCCCGER